MNYTISNHLKVVHFSRVHKQNPLENNDLSVYSNQVRLHSSIASRQRERVLYSERPRSTSTDIEKTIIIYSTAINPLSRRWPLLPSHAIWSCTVTYCLVYRKIECFVSVTNCSILLCWCNHIIYCMCVFLFYNCFSYLKWRFFLCFLYIFQRQQLVFFFQHNDVDNNVFFNLYLLLD